MKTPVPSIKLLLSGGRGIYLPRDFIQDFDLSKWEGIKEWEIEQLQNPDNDFYWDAWENVLNNATYTQDGRMWRLHQNGDLWAACFELMTEEEKINFGFDID